uniref:Retrotrans_gag domain-containing protein n=1 Tax=Strongyloides venezuelensis TaxID=75913 RepID=A0A0K0EUX7_STRVS
MKKKAQLETLKKALAKAGKWNKDIDNLLTDYWTREEYEAAEEIVNGILEEMTKESMKNTEQMAEGRGTFKDSTDLDRTEVIRTLPEDMTPTMRMGLMEHNWTEEAQEKPKGVITDMWDKLRIFKGDTAVELRIWLRRYELALEMKHPDQTRNAMEYMKLYFLEDFLQDKARRLYCTALDKPGRLSYGQVVSYIMERLEEPINRLRANMERLKFYREPTTIHQHFTEFIKKTMATGNMLEEVLMGNISEQEARVN